MGLGGVGVGTRLRTSCFGGLGVLGRRLREGKRGCVRVFLLGGESDIKDGAVTARGNDDPLEAVFAGSDAFRGEEYWADVGRGSRVRKRA